MTFVPIETVANRAPLHHPMVRPVVGIVRIESRTGLDERSKFRWAFPLFPLRILSSPAAFRRRFLWRVQSNQFLEPLIRNWLPRRIIFEKTAKPIKRCPEVSNSLDQVFFS